MQIISILLFEISKKCLRKAFKLILFNFKKTTKRSLDFLSNPAFTIYVNLNKNI